MESFRRREEGWRKQNGHGGKAIGHATGTTPRNCPVVVTKARSSGPAAPSRLHGPGWVNSPSMNVSVSLPSGSRPEPTRRGAAAKPALSRWRSSECTAGVHGLVSRITTLPRRWTTFRPPPSRRIKSSGEVTVHCDPGPARPANGFRSASIDTGNPPLQMAGWAGFHLSHPTTSTRRQTSILEPEVPAGGIERESRHCLDGRKSMPCAPACKGV